MNSLEKQLKLTWDYYAMWFVMLAGVSVISKPWNFDLPWFSKTAFIIVVPFLMMMAVYVPILFVIATIRSGTQGVIILMRFLSFVLVAGVIFGFLLLSGKYTPERARSIGAILTAFGIGIVNYKIGNKAIR